MVANFRAVVQGKVLKDIRGSRSVSRRALDRLKAFLRTLTGNPGTAVEQSFRSFTEAARAASPEVLMHALEPAFDLSQKWVPVDTGKLKSSGYLEILRRGKTPTVQMGYGKRGNPNYAIAVHENLVWRHKAPTRAKFLQEAINSEVGNINNRIVASFRV